MLRTTILIILSFLLSVNFVQAQTRDMGGPVSFLQTRTLEPVRIHQMPEVDVEECLRIDALNTATKAGAYRFGYEHAVQLGIDNAGTWTELENGDRIWRLAVQSKGALSLNLIFGEFYMPIGASMHLYAPQTGEVQGAYTSYNNNEFRVLGTSIITGDQLVVEYFEPAGARGHGALSVETVVHAYKAVAEVALAAATRGLNDSGDCNIDVNCPLGDGWQNEINSVAIIFAGGGLCSGALINNTENDGKPYFLTANHCLGGDVGTWVFRFNWESPVSSCAETTFSQDPGGPYNNINGAFLRSYSSGSDFALLELFNQPHISWDIHYCGWDRASTGASFTTGIHHPSGDVKKICRDDNVPVSTSNGGISVWRIANWDQGVTEGGSSGSPLFDENHRIVGQLFGGSAACAGTTDNNQSDNYGRLNTSWNGNTPARRLKDWLDPNNTNAMFMDGFTPGPPVANDAGIIAIHLPSEICNSSEVTAVVELYNHGLSPLTSAKIYYSIDGGTASSFDWTGNIASYSSAAIILPALTSSPGAHTFSAYTDIPNGVADVNAFNDSKEATFEMTEDANALNVEFSLSLDNFGSENRWEVTFDGDLVASGGPYADGTTATLTENLCLAEECYVFRIYDTGGNGLETGVGAYSLQDASGNILVEMPANGFGGLKIHPFCVTTATSTELLTVSDLFQISPNPAQNKLFIEISALITDDAHLKIYSSTGKLVKNISQLTTNQQTINISDLASGIYIVKVFTDNKIMTQRLMK